MQGCGKTFKRRIGARKDDVSPPLCAMAACTAAADAKWIREREEKWGSKGGKWEEVGKVGKSVTAVQRGEISSMRESLISLGFFSHFGQDFLATLWTPRFHQDSSRAGLEPVLSFDCQRTGSLPPKLVSEWHQLYWSRGKAHLHWSWPPRTTALYRLSEVWLCACW